MRFVHELMVAPAITVESSANLSHAAILMLTRKISGLPVVDSAGELTGVITEGDFLRRPEYGTHAVNGTFWAEPFGVDAAERYRRAHGLRIADVMSTRVVSIGSRDTLSDAVRLMIYHEIKRLPVVDNGALVGMLSRFDFLRAFVAARDAQRVPSASLEETVRDALARQEWAPKTKIVVSLRGDRVLLRGHVHSDTQRRAAIVLAEEIVGLGKVDTEIAVGDLKR